MSTRAQYYLEQGLPELLDLKRKGVFDEREVQAIARKRTGFEEALARKVVRKADFLRYVEYEVNLEALRRSRVRSKKIKDTKRSISDWAGPRRILFVYERATVKFHGDVDLWLQYIDYARSQKATKQLSRIFAKVLQLHPRSAKLWIAAADYEWSVNGNVVAARNLALRGLRINDDSIALIQWYYRLELQFASQLLSRRQILGLQSGASNSVSEDGAGQEGAAQDETDFGDADMIVINTDDGDDTIEAPADATKRIVDGALPLALLQQQSRREVLCDAADLWRGLYDATLDFVDLALAPQMLELCRDGLARSTDVDERLLTHGVYRAALQGSEVDLLLALAQLAEHVQKQIEAGLIIKEVLLGILSRLDRLHVHQSEDVARAAVHLRSHVTAIWLDANTAQPVPGLLYVLGGIKSSETGDAKAITAEAV